MKTTLFALLLVASTVTAGPAENPLGLKIHHVTATVQDLKRATEWYQRVLGFKPTRRENHGTLQMAVVSIPGFDVGLVQDGQSSQAAASVSGARWVHVVFSVQDPDRLFERLSLSGAKPYVYGGAVTHPVKSFLLKDSEGNEIEIVSAEPSN
jgi:catechol 2,3-dioxygenase-like lactoylglutathione lyase family enzyme